MADPSRPVTGATIASVWGQGVHDATFAPKGVHVTSGTSKVCGSSAVNLFMDTAVDDPGGWANLASDNVTVPTGAGGVYDYVAVLNTVNGDAGESTRGFLYVNSVQQQGSTGNNDGSTNVKFNVGGFVELAAGDIIHIRAQKTGGASPDVTLYHLWLIRRATELGA